MSRSAAAAAPEQDHRAPRPRSRPRPHGVAQARRAPGPAGGRGAGVEAHAYREREAYAPPRPRAPSRPPLRLAAGGASIALRCVESAMEVSGSRTMDRLVRSRAWVVIIGIGLIGIVAMQVSLLKLNSGIGRAVDTVATLERSNASLKGEISRLSSGDRIQALAGQRGFVMPEPADVTYLRAGELRSTGFQAARRMRAADPTIVGPAGSLLGAAAAPVIGGAATASAPVAADPAAGTSGTTPATTADAAANPAAPVTAPPADATVPPAVNGAATAPPVAPATDAAPIDAATATAPATPATTASGGVTP